MWLEDQASRAHHARVAAQLGLDDPVAAELTYAASCLDGPSGRPEHRLSPLSHPPPHTDTARVTATATLVTLGRAAETEPIVRDVLTRRAWGSAYDVLGQVLRQRHDVAGAIDAFRHQATAGATLGYGGDHCLGLVAVAELELERRDRVAAAAALAEATPVCTQHAITDAAPRLAALRTALAISGTDR